MGQVFRQLLELHGLDAIALARDAGLDLGAVPDPGQRLEIARFDALVAAAAARIGDPAFGLKAAECWHPANLGALGYAWLSSSTLRTGLMRLDRYWRILGEAGVGTIVETGDAVRFSYQKTAGDPAVAPIYADVTLAILLAMCRMNAGSDLRPRNVALARNAPADPAVYENFFGCPVRFGAGENTFELATADANRELPTSNKVLAATFDQMLATELARLDKTDVIARCKTVILEQLTSGEVSEEVMSRELHMSQRTLQRKLSEAETTYRQLVDDTRRDLALRYVSDPSRSLTDIAFLVGFSQQSAFTRAFRRWTGRSPSEYRDEKKAPESVA